MSRNYIPPLRSANPPDVTGNFTANQVDAITTGLSLIANAAAVVYSAVSQAAMLALSPTPQKGDLCLRSDLGNVIYAFDGGDPTIIGNWSTASAAAPVSSVFGRTGAIVAATNDYSFAQVSGSVAAAQMPALTGDVTSVAGTVATTLATVQPGAHTWNATQIFSDNTINSTQLIILQNLSGGGYATFSVEGSAGDGVTNWPNSTVFESVPVAGGNLVLSAYSGSVILQTGARANQALIANAAGNINIPAATASTSPTTGAVVVTGGLGVGGAARVAGLISGENATGPAVVQANATGGGLNNFPILQAFRSGIANSVLATTSTGLLKLINGGGGYSTDATINAAAGMTLNTAGAGVFSSTVTATQFIGPATALSSATTTVAVSGATAPTAGQVLTATSGTVANWQTPAAGATGHLQSQTFTASGTFTPATGVNFVDIICQGAGGGGAGGNTSAVDAGGGGGGAGATIRKRVPVTPGVGITVTIGAGGTAGPINGGGGNGADTTFGALCTAKGGLGGVQGGTTVGGTGGASGGPDTTLGGGRFPISAAANAASNSYSLANPAGALESGGGGGTGGGTAASSVPGGACSAYLGGTASATTNDGGGGGSSPLGRGGAGGSASAGVGPTANTGAGGGGGTAAFAGATGAAGQVIVQWVA